MSQKEVSCSPVPRLPRSGMRTLKLCRRGELVSSPDPTLSLEGMRGLVTRLVESLGVFCHVKSAKGWIIVCGRTRDSEQEKERK